MREFSIKIVLVRTLYDSNIGGVSRAMDNMAATDLILIDRKCEITYKAQQAAASGQSGLQNRHEYSSWSEFLSEEPEGLRLAFSARDGRGRPLWDFAKILQWLKTEDPRLTKQGPPLPIYLIFGPEDWGLSNEDLEHCHFNTNIPTFGENSSLNLAQAVLLALFILRSEWGGQRTKLDGQQPARHQPKTQNIFPDQTLKKFLEELGFSLRNRRVNVYTVLRRMLFHNVPTEKELRILETVLQQGVRKLRQYNQNFATKEIIAVKDPSTDFENNVTSE